VHELRVKGQRAVIGIPKPHFTMNLPLQIIQEYKGCQSGVDEYRRGFPAGKWDASI
jgi:hypothetical protein